MKKFRAFINKHKGWTTLVAATIILFSAFSICTSLSGCQYYTDGQGQEVVRLTDDTADVLDKAAELAPVVTDALIGVSVAVPALAGVLGIVGGAITAFFGAYKKYRPQITREQYKAELGSNMTKALVFAIEQYKISNGGSWDDLKEYIRKELSHRVGPEALAIVEAVLKSYHNNIEE